MNSYLVCHILEADREIGQWDGLLRTNGCSNLLSLNSNSSVHVYALEQVEVIASLPQDPSVVDKTTGMQVRTALIECREVRLHGDAAEGIKGALDDSSTICN
jgi:hypothetical protein